MPRKNVFVRPPVANLDVLFIVASTVQPVPSTLVIDKLTAIAVDRLSLIHISMGGYSRRERNRRHHHAAG